ASFAIFMLRNRYFDQYFSGNIGYLDSRGLYFLGVVPEVEQTCTRVGINNQFAFNYRKRIFNRNHRITYCLCSSQIIIREIRYAYKVQGRQWYTLLDKVTIGSQAVRLINNMKVKVTAYAGYVNFPIRSKLGQIKDRTKVRKTINIKRIN